MVRLIPAALLLATTPAFAQPAAAPQPMPTSLPFSPAIRVGDILYMSGQIGQVPEGMDAHKDGFDAAVRGAMDAIGGILKDNGLDFGDVVKCTVMLDDMADWPRFNAAYTPYATRANQDWTQRSLSTLEDPRVARTSCDGA